MSFSRVQRGKFFFSFNSKVLIPSSLSSQSKSVNSFFDSKTLIPFSLILRHQFLPFDLKDRYQWLYITIVQYELKMLNNVIL